VTPSIWPENTLDVGSVFLGPPSRPTDAGSTGCPLLAAPNCIIETGIAYFRGRALCAMWGVRGVWGADARTSVCAWAWACVCVRVCAYVCVCVRCACVRVRARARARARSPVSTGAVPKCIRFGSVLDRIKMILAGN